MTPGPAPAVVSAHLQVRGDGGFAPCPCQAVQAPPSPIAPATQPARSDHPRHPPQDHRTARARGGLRSGDGARCADPIATAAPAWMEALFLPRPEVECIIYEGMRIAGLPEGRSPFRVKGGCGRQADGIAGLSPAPEIPVRYGTYASCHRRHGYDMKEASN